MTTRGLGKMNKDLYFGWLKALTDGTYKRGEGCLRSEDNKFCPLGILRDVAEGEWSANPDDGAYIAIPVEGDVSTGMLPEYERELFGLSREVCDDIVTCSDDDTTFHQMAGIIESMVTNGLILVESR